jgi:hypothetical protein
MHMGNYQGISVLFTTDARANQYKAVSVAGTIAATSNAAYGLQQTKPNSGQHGDIGFFGEMKAWAGGTINSGGLVKVTTSGFIVAATSGDTAIGKCLSGAASGDVFAGLFNFVTGQTLVA